MLEPANLGKLPDGPGDLVCSTETLQRGASGRRVVEVPAQSRLEANVGGKGCRSRGHGQSATYCEILSTFPKKKRIGRAGNLQMMHAQSFEK